MSPRVRFGDYEFDFDKKSLSKFGRRISLQPQPAIILSTLLENAGELVSRQGIRDRLWEPNVFVDYEHSINRSVNRLRQALCDTADNPRYIETVTGQGYRFIGEMSIVVAPEITQDGRQRKVPQPAAVAVPAASPSVTRPEPLPDMAAPRDLWLMRKRLPALAGVVLLCGLLSAWAWVWTKGREAKVPRLVVLPVKNLTGDTQQEVVAEGLTEELTAASATLGPETLGVLARTSAAKYKDATKSAGEIGRELNADYVIECSLRKGESRYRITAQLIRTSDELHVWSATYDRDYANPVDLQSDIAIAVSEQVYSRLAHKDPKISPKNPAEAELLYRKAIYLLSKRTPMSVRTSLGFFKDAVRIDPDYAAAHAGLAHAYLVAGGGHLPSREAYGLGREAAQRALQLNPLLADAHAALGYVKFIDEMDWEGSENEYRRALDLDPNNAPAHHWYAIYLAAFKRYSEALAHIDRSLELDPTSVAATYNKGMILIQSGRYEDAIRHLQAATELEPTSPVTPGYLAIAYEQLGRLDDAEREYKEAQRLSGSEWPYVVGIAQINVLKGNRSEARRLLTRMLSRRRANVNSVSACGLALIYEALDERNRALDWLERAIDERTCTITEYNSHGFDKLRSEPRFTALAARLNLSDTSVYARRDNSPVAH